MLKYIIFTKHIISKLHRFTNSGHFYLPWGRTLVKCLRDIFIFLNKSSMLKEKQIN